MCVIGQAVQCTSVLLCGIRLLWRVSSRGSELCRPRLLSCCLSVLAAARVRGWRGPRVTMQAPTALTAWSRPRLVCVCCPTTLFLACCLLLRSDHPVYLCWGLVLCAVLCDNMCVCLTEAENACSCSCSKNRHPGAVLWPALLPLQGCSGDTRLQLQDAAVCCCC